MGEPFGRQYRRKDATPWVFSLLAVLWGGGGLYLLASTGSTSGWFLILAVGFAAGAVLSRRRPYAVVNASEFTVWLSPFQPQTLPWAGIVSARRIGVRVRLELAGGTKVDVRWDSVPLDMRERFVEEFARNLGPRWVVGEYDARSLARDVRSEAWRQWGLLVTLGLVAAGVITLLFRAGYIAVPAFFR